MDRGEESREDVSHELSRPTVVVTKCRCVRLQVLLTYSNKRHRTTEGGERDHTSPIMSETETKTKVKSDLKKRESRDQLFLHVRPTGDETFDVRERPPLFSEVGVCRSWRGPGPSVPAESEEKDRRGTPEVD